VRQHLLASVFQTFINPNLITDPPREGSAIAKGRYS